MKQRGVALIIALILVALATILATKLTYDGFLERRRAIGVLAAEQALHFGMGAEALAADVLTQDLQNSPTLTTLTGPWAQPTQPLPITPQDNPEGEPIGTLQGELEDMQGRFNLNNLGRIADAGPQGTTAAAMQDPEPLAQFQRLLVLVGLEPKWAGMARELMNLPGFGADRYRKIAPYVTALPTAKATINICTASAPVLETLLGNSSKSEYSPEVLAAGRKTGCFPDPTSFGNILGAQRTTISKYYGTKSDYFRLTTRITLGTTEFTLYSLLYRGNGGKVTPVLRSFGTP
jgi:general secretion pathway protein K